MPELTASEVARVCGGVLAGDGGATAWGVSADSRVLRAGTAFVAIGRGHAHVADALSAGAPFAIVERAEALPAGSTGVMVADVQRALASLATHVRGRLHIDVVAITGSTGKTLTKDLTATALAPEFAVHAAPASYNNEVGTPLTVLSCPDEAGALVAELGARRPGDISALCAIVRPSVGVVTGIGVTHMEIFGSRAAIARTKGELVESLPADGTAVLPSNDDFVADLAARTNARVVTVGPGGHVRATAVATEADGRCRAHVVVGDRSVVDVRVPLPGRALVRNACMALAAAAAAGVDPSRAADAISSIDPATLSSWRMQIGEAGGRTIVNDAYNSNPTSAAFALRTVRRMAGARPSWAVLGPMAELGRAAPAEHVRLGRVAAALGFDRVVVVGELAAGIAEGAGSIATSVDTPAAAAMVVERESPQDAVVLVKGSRVAGLEAVADALRTAVTA